MNGRRLRSFLAAALAALALAATAAAETFTLELGAGWNLVSVPLVPDDPAIGAVTLPVAGDLVSVWAYRGGSWTFYDPLDPAFSDLATVEAGAGYWFNMARAASLTVAGSEAPAVVDLGEGWNLVGFSGSAAVGVADAFAPDVAAKVVSVWACEGGLWSFYDPLDPAFSDLAAMGPGSGYWVDASIPAVWGLPLATVTAAGNVSFDDGTPVQGATVSAAAASQPAIDGVRRQYELSLRAPDAPGTPGARGRRPAPLSLDVVQSVSTTTDAQGNYSLAVPAGLPAPVKVKVDVLYQPAGGPPATNSRWGEAKSAALAIPDIVVPAVSAATRVALSGGSGGTPDGGVRVDGMPAEVVDLNARGYDPGQTPAAFPGNFTEMDSIDLNSSAFVWLEGLDATGQPVHQLGQEAAVRVPVAKSQWGDLEDLAPGNGRVDIPMYAFDEDVKMWRLHEASGWLEAADRTALPEEALPLVLGGTYPGEIYAAFTTTHLSWLNVDYSYLGPWTFTKLSAGRRMSDCLDRAVRLARAIFRTSWGNAAYSLVNVAGQDVNTEVLDGGASELKDEAFADNTMGETRQGDFKDLIHLNEKLWDSCDDAGMKESTVLSLAMVILHETAHWKHDAKKHGGVFTTEDEPGEEGEAGYAVVGRLLGWDNSSGLFLALVPETGALPLGAGNPFCMRHVQVVGGAYDPVGDAHYLTPEARAKLSDPQWWKSNDGQMSQGFWDSFWATATAASPSRPRPGAGFRRGGPAPLAGSPPVRITLSAASTAFALGDPMPVNVEYENVSAESAAVLDAVLLPGCPLGFEIARLDGSGNPTPATVGFVGPKVNVPFGLAGQFASLEPGQKLVKTVDLVRDESGAATRYNFAAAGKYRVTAVYGAIWGLPRTLSSGLDIEVTAGGTVAGKVSDADTGEPVAGASVWVRDPATGAVLATATAGATGEYATAELGRGSYAVSVWAAYYRSATRAGVAVAPGAASQVDFALALWAKGGGAAGDLVDVDPIVGNLRYAPAGTFVQGSPAGEPCRYSNETQFTHTLTKSLAVMETEVTRQMWADLKAARPTLPADPTNTAYGAGKTNPVQSVTWYEAVLFANLLSLQRGLTPCYYADAGFATPIDAANYTAGPFYCDWNAGGYRLPSEAEWEYFCRAGTTTPFWIAEPNYTSANCGSTSTLGMYPSLETAAWFWANNTPYGTKPVGTKASNPWNLKDVHGNVWEYCWDWYGTYPAGSATDYRGAAGGSIRVLRGGSWNNVAQDCRSANRVIYVPGARLYYLGFRLARSLP